MKQLVTTKKTDVIKGFKKKSGTGTFDARLFINDEFKVRFEFDNGPRGPEPDANQTTSAVAAQIASQASSQVAT
jgi:hypothetical protein